MQRGQRTGRWAKVWLLRRLRADWQAVRRRFEADADRRGMVLIMTLLMVSILTTLGSAAVVHTSTELREGGGFRLERDVYRISEAGTVAMISIAGQMQGAFENHVANTGYDFNHGYAEFERHLVGPSLELDAGADSPSFGRELQRFATTSTVDFRVRVYRPELSAAVAGYDASRFCFRNYRMVTTAIVGLDAPENVNEATDPAGEAAIAAQVLVGPSPCGG